MARESSVYQPHLDGHDSQIAAQPLAELAEGRPQIAATARAFGLELVTHNPADFAGIPGLTVITEVP